MEEVSVRRREPNDEREVEAFLEERSALRVARLGRLDHALEHPALLAEHDDNLVDESRALLKPEIPRIGDHGIDLRDELELDKVPDV